MSSEVISGHHRSSEGHKRSPAIRGHQRAINGHGTCKVARRRARTSSDSWAATSAGGSLGAVLSFPLATKVERSAQHSGTLRGWSSPVHT